MQNARCVERSSWSPRRPYIPVSPELDKPYILQGIGTSKISYNLVSSIGPSPKEGFSRLYSGIIPGKYNDMVFDKLETALNMLVTKFTDATGVSTDEKGLWYLCTDHYIQECNGRFSYFYMPNSNLVVTEVVNEKRRDTVARKGIIRESNAKKPHE